MSTLSSKLILSLINRVTAPARAVERSMGRLRQAAEQNQRQMNAMRGRMMAAAGAGYALYRGLLAPTKAAMDFESAMADVRKVVDFPTPQAFRQMGKDIIEMSKRLPMAADGIAAIVAAAGQAGMKGNELLAFAEMATKVGVAFDMSADQVGTALAKIKTSLGLTVDETGTLADAINHLSNTSASSAPDLINFMRRVGSEGKKYGFTAEQTAAYGSAMIASGAQADVAATSFRNMGKALARGGSATKRQRKAFAKLGLDAKKVAKNLQKDAVGTLNQVIEKIRALPKHLQASTISNLFGDEARAISPLIQNAKLLEDALGSVANKANFLGSAQKEYEVRAQTTANKMQLFKNQVSALGIAIGSALLPAITDLMKQISPIIARVAEWAEKNPQLTRTIVAVTAAVIALSAASAAAKFALLFVKGGLIDVAIVGLRAASGLLALLNPLKLVTSAMRILRIAVVSTGIGAVLVGIAMAGTWIYNNWSNLSAMFASFGAAFKRALRPVMPIVQPVIDAAGWLADAWGRVTGTVEGGTGKWHLWGAAAGRAVGDALISVIDFGKRMTASIGQTWSSLSNVFQSAGAVAAAKEAVKPMINAVKTGLEAAKPVLSAAWDKTSAFFNSGNAGRHAARGVKKLIDLYGQALTAGKDVLVRAWDTATNFWNKTDKVGVIKTVAKTYVNAVATVLNAGKAILKTAWTNALSFGDELSNGGMTKMVTAVQKAIDDIIVVFKGLPKQVGIIVDEMVNWFKTLPGRIIAAIGNIDLSGILKWPSLPTWLGGAKAPPVPAIAGARAMGGAVAGGQTYLIGERGPELFTAPRSGYITPNHQLNQSGAQAAVSQPQSGQTGSQDNRAAGPISITIGDIIVKEAQNAGQIAREIGQQLRDELSGMQADSEFSVS